MGEGGNYERPSRDRIMAARGETVVDQETGSVAWRVGAHRRGRRMRSELRGEIGEERTRIPLPSPGGDWDPRGVAEGLGCAVGMLGWTSGLVADRRARHGRTSTCLRRGTDRRQSSGTGSPCGGLHRAGGNGQGRMPQPLSVEQRRRHAGWEGGAPFAHPQPQSAPGEPVE